jgi:hypothetical protein
MAELAQVEMAPLEKEGVSEELVQGETGPAVDGHLEA